MTELIWENNVLDVPSTCGILTGEEITLTTQYDAVDLIRLMKEGKYSVEAVTVAFCKRAAIALQLVRTIERAESLDLERRSKPTSALGPLFGLPISLKDSFEIPGFNSTIGFVAYVNRPATKPSNLTMMTSDSDNHIWGRTLNPSNTALTAGGSSGGEAALIALRGSVAGIGTDIAGSVRIPAAACGIYAIRTSADVIPLGNKRLPVKVGLPYITPVVGPMCTSARACRYLLECIIKAHPPRYDSQCINLSWPASLPRYPPDHQCTLRIGVAEDDGLLSVTPPQRRALEHSVNALKAVGIDIVPIKLPQIGQILQNLLSNFAMDGGEFVRNVLAQTGEPLVPSAAILVQKDGTAQTLGELAQSRELRAQHQERYRLLWNATQIDALIMPPASHTAVPHDTWRAITYTALWNYLDNPSAVMPVDRVNGGDVADHGANYGEMDRAYYALYTGPEDYRNAPTAIQVVGRRQEDANLALLVEYLDGVIHRRGIDSVTSARKLFS
ncbi:hypothetical protein P175DRAFT_0510812 [Aspergillus ochraceoroseus IBT 24754]|uniref:amidase n=2 Tax=Aspergillus ochraceoroseus TaxID=138278 RepID=A0A2T5LTG3_9EURO|nr:uncharacterized protein P175DRAFT_0510812 [Aspergillus ochraceoroseus IBT 24754]PTU19574.1 hypothetical protein P175DRAFT_0510812 [Aspergillus ochraceoroseus IBT 24754]